MDPLDAALGGRSCRVSLPLPQLPLPAVAAACRCRCCHCQPLPQSPQRLALQRFPDERQTVTSAHATRAQSSPKGKRDSEGMH